MKNKSGCRYEVKITVGKRIDGTPLRKSFYGKSKREAKAKAEEYLIENGKQIRDPASTLTFSELTEMYFSEKKNFIRNNSLNSLHCVMKRLNDYFENQKIVSITKREVSEYLAALAEDYSESYLKMIYSFLSGCFDYAVDNGWLQTSPCHGLKFKSKNKPKERRVYNQEEADAILEFTLTRADGLSVHLMLGYGTSTSETLGIKYSDVDFEAGTISINQSVTKASGKIDIGDPKNSHRKRTIAISSDTVEFIRRTCKPEYKYLIHSGDNPDSPYDPKHWRWQIYKKFMTAAKEHLLEQDIDIEILNPHELRHSRATLWVNEDRNLFAIAEEMGWSDLQMLRKVYGHPDIQKIKNMLGIDSK